MTRNRDSDKLLFDVQHPHLLREALIVSFEYLNPNFSAISATIEGRVLFACLRNPSISAALRGEHLGILAKACSIHSTLLSKKARAFFVLIKYGYDKRILPVGRTDSDMLDARRVCERVTSPIYGWIILVSNSLSDYFE